MTGHCICPTVLQPMIAIGDQLVTVEEFQKLVQTSNKIVQFRGVCVGFSD